MTHNTDIVYLAFKNTVDWIGPPPIFSGIGLTVAETLKFAGLNELDIAFWLNDEDHIRAYFSVRAFDMTTSPPTQLDPPDLKLGGGPYLGNRAGV